MNHRIQLLVGIERHRKGHLFRDGLPLQSISDVPCSGPLYLGLDVGIVIVSLKPADFINTSVSVADFGYLVIAVF